MGIFGNRRGPDGQERGRTRARRRNLEFTTLEDRRLLTVGTVTAVVTPSILVPPDGRFVPVTVTGSIFQVVDFVFPGPQKTPPPPAELAKIDAGNATRPFPGKALFQVTDQYRRDEPRGHIPIHLVATVNSFIPGTGSTNAIERLLRQFTYTVTFHLQAKRSTRLPVGRHYYILVAAGDQDGGDGTTVAVLVPRDPAHPDVPHPPKAAGK
jgi:hypothetical protein